MAKQDTKPLEVWESRHYYDLAREGSLDTRHFGTRVLKRLAKDSFNILDMGCGEGTRLDYVVVEGKKGVGVDISGTAISLARKSYPNLKFVRANLEKLPLKGESFDLVYSAFVLEHLMKPEKVVQEAVRVTKRGGHLVFIAPNFGAPNRASPVFRGSRVKKFLYGIFRDVTMAFRKIKSLQWNKVQPIEDTEGYRPDYDTVVEPYIGTLKVYLKHRGCRVLTTSTCWEEELPAPKFQQRIFRLLSKINLYPFTLWGPHLVVVAQRS